MKTIVVLLALAGAVALALPQRSEAQSVKTYSRVYDPNTVETVSGHVVSVLHRVHGWHGAYGEHVVLNTKSGRLDVHLGPAWFMRRQGVKLEPDDFITVTGSRVMLGGVAVLIAAQITKGHETWVLRNAQGVPAWRRSRYKQ